MRMIILLRHASISFWTAHPIKRSASEHPDLKTIPPLKVKFPRLVLVVMVVLSLIVFGMVGCKPQPRVSAAFAAHLEVGVNP